MDIGKEILKSIQIMIDKKLDNYRADRTYRTVIKRIDKNGYIITDEAGQERTVPCGIPNVSLKVGQTVYVKMVQGKIKDMYICGVL